MPVTGDTGQGSQRKLTTHYHQAGWMWGLLGLVSNETRVRLYIPRKKADKVGLTRSPQAEFFGFWSSRGPASPMTRAPTGAVRRMASTAIVSTSMPYFFSTSSSRVMAMSRAVEPIAACRKRKEVCWCISSPRGRGKQSNICERQHRRTCTVALGIHASAMNTFSRTLKPVNRTQT